MTDCVFCGIVARTQPADVVGTTQHTVAFRDVNPRGATTSS